MHLSLSLKCPIKLCWVEWCRISVIASLIQNLYRYKSCPNVSPVFFFYLLWKRRISSPTIFFNSNEKGKKCPMWRSVFLSGKTKLVLRSKKKKIFIIFNWKPKVSKLWFWQNKNIKYTNCKIFCCFWWKKAFFSPDKNRIF